MNESNQNEQTSTEAKAETTAEAKPARKRKSTAAKSTKGKSGEKTKTAQARSIFKALSRGKDGPNRKKIIERFVADVKLTPAGASTYYQKLLTEHKAEAKKEARKAS